MDEVTTITSAAIYSARWTTTRGWQWKKERDCAASLADTWLSVFQKDEPEIDFIVYYGNTKPKIKINKPAPKLF